MIFDAALAGCVDRTSNGAERWYRDAFLDETCFEEVGTISFGNGDALRFRSLDTGEFVASADPELRQGTAAWEVDGGAGAFASATGRIASNFLVSKTRELTDHELGVIFEDERELLS